jgi:hypothetical protein
LFGLSDGGVKLRAIVHVQTRRKIVGRPPSFLFSLLNFWILILEVATMRCGTSRKRVIRGLTLRVFFSFFFPFFFLFVCYCYCLFRFAIYAFGHGG